MDRSAPARARTAADAPVRASRAASARLPCLLLCLVLGAAGTGCARPGGAGGGPPRPGERINLAGPEEPAADKPFDRGSPLQQQRVAEQLATFEDPEGLPRIEAARRLAALGEPAIPPLLSALASHPSGRTRGMAAYTLGYMKDRRTLDPLAAALMDGDPEVRYEVATALVRVGDDRGLAALVTGLEDPDPRVRLRCISILNDAIGATYGFRADDEPLDRQAAVARWRAWLQRRREVGPRDGV